VPRRTWAAAQVVEGNRLQAIRDLAHKMKAAGLWLSKLELAEFVRAQRTCGHDLEQRLVVPLLHHADHAYLTGMNVGTFFARRPRVRMPLIAAFGNQMGLALHSCVRAAENDRERVGHLCALFNLFIALFDRLCDRRDAGFASLVTVFDELMFRRLAGNVDILADLKRAAASAEYPVLRVVLAIFVAFYGQVQEFAKGRRAAPFWQRLNAELIEAYRAEIVTVSRQRDHVSERDLHTAACRKSVLPFQIMLTIAQLSGNNQPCADTAECLAQHIGMAFSLTDDLADLSRDYINGDANTILLSEVLPSGQGHTLNRALPGSRLYEAVDAIVTHLAAAINLFNSTMDRRRFRDMLVGYTQSWLGADDQYLTRTTSRDAPPLRP
jgi:hypothetical protein